jgi:hypothetical protein
VAVVHSLVAAAVRAFLVAARPSPAVGVGIPFPAEVVADTRPLAVEVVDTPSPAVEAVVVDIIADPA